MSEILTWKFEHSNIWFNSPPEKLNKHINKAMRDLEIHPDTKIIFKNDRSTTTILSDSISGTDSIQIEPLSISDSEIQPQETPVLSGMSDLVDKPVPTPTSLPTPTPTVTTRGRSFGPGL
jgi:hypothetical protein